MTDHTERWLPVPDYEGLYEVSSLSRVRSLDRIVMSRNRQGPMAKHLHGGILAQRTDYYGYLAVALYRNGKRKSYRVHRLVGEAFHGHRPPGMDTLHGPDRKANSVTDIRYGTRAENEQDKIRDGTFKHGGDGRVGEACSNVKLTEVAVIEIRQRYAAGQSQPELAKIFGVTQGNISRITRNETWKHLL